MRDYIVVMIILGLLPLVLFRPFAGVLLGNWVGIMNPHRLTYGFAYDYPFAAIVFAVTFVAWLFSREPKTVPLKSSTVILILFILWMAVTSALAEYPDQAWGFYLNLLKIFAMLYVAMAMLTSRERLDQLIWIVVISLGFFGVKGGLFTIATGGSYMVLGPENSFITGNTEIALAMTMALPLMRYLQLETKKTWVKRGLMMAMFLTGFAIIGSYSRGAFVAVSAMAFLLWLKSRNKMPVAIVMLVAIPLILAFMPDKWSVKMSTIETYEQDQSAMGRVNAWWFAYNYTLDHPIAGGGFGVFNQDLFNRYAPNPDFFQDAHSIYFQVLGTQGYVGLALFLGLGITAWRSGKWIIAHARGRPELSWAQNMAAMIQVSLIGYAVGGAFLSLAYFDVPYLLVGMITMLRAYLEKADSAKARK